MVLFNRADVIQKIRETGTSDRRQGSGRPVTASTEQNQRFVVQRSISDKERPGTSLSEAWYVLVFFAKWHDETAHTKPEEEEKRYNLRSVLKRSSNVSERQRLYLLGLLR